MVLVVNSFERYLESKKPGKLESNFILNNLIWSRVIPKKTVTLVLTVLLLVNVLLLGIRHTAKNED